MVWSVFGDQYRYKDEELDRPRGILTKSDRELIMGEIDDLSDRALEQRKIRLRRRVRNALMDGLLLMELDPEDRRLIFSPRDRKEEQKVRAGAALLFQWVYKGMKETEIDVTELVKHTASQVEKRDAKKRGEYVEPVVHFSVSIEDSVDIEEAIEKLQQGRPLRGKEVAVIRDSDYQPTEDELDFLLDQFRQDGEG